MTIKNQPLCMLVLAAAAAKAQVPQDKRAFGVLPNCKTVEPGALAKPLTGAPFFVRAANEFSHAGKRPGAGL